MKRTIAALILAALIFAGWLPGGQAGPGPRYLDTAPDRSDAVRIVILDPAEEGINALIGLRKQGFLDIENMVAIGLYHARERANYLKAMELVRADKLDWIKFHELTGDIDAASLFRKNSLSPDFEAAFRKSDGVVFFGGYDIPPEIYGEKTGLLTRILTPYRHFIEISFAHHLLGSSRGAEPRPFLDSRPDYPVLGICLGFQTLNVGTGGTLHQDIWSEVYGKTTFEDVLAIGRDNWHKNPYPSLFPGQSLYSINIHPIRLLTDGKYVTSFGFSASDAPVVRCGHHQALDRLGKGLKVNALSTDGKVIEGFEHEKYPNVLGVAFHPEDPRLWDPGLMGKFAPADEKDTSWRAVLEANPPSFEFHTKIWSWLGRKLKASRAATSIPKERP